MIQEPSHKWVNILRSFRVRKRSWMMEAIDSAFCVLRLLPPAVSLSDPVCGWSLVCFPPCFSSALKNRTKKKAKGRRGTPLCGIFPHRKKHQNRQWPRPKRPWIATILGVGGLTLEGIKQSPSIATIVINCLPHLQYKWVNLRDLLILQTFIEIYCNWKIILSCVTFYYSSIEQ